MKQRILDWLREREIRRLSKRELEAIQAGDIGKAGHFRRARYKAILERSSWQIERMELSKGLRARTTVKRGVMNSFFHHHIPAPVVSLLFKVFKLGNL